MDTIQSTFYRLPARLLEEGMSTDDGQDILDIARGGELAFASVYTPRSDDSEQDELNRGEPETRLYEANEWVDLAVFADTRVDGSGYAEAELVDR
jgi:hypothetical protein